MSWQDIPIGDAPAGVALTVTKKQVTVRLGGAVTGRLGWTSGIRLKASLGRGDDDGWLRLFPAEDGREPACTTEGLDLGFYATVLPGLALTKSTPLHWYVADPVEREEGADPAFLMIRLPIQPTRRPMPPGRRPVRGAGPVEVTVTAAPPERAEWTKKAWADGHEIQWLTDGTLVFNGEKMAVEDAESIMRRRA